MDFKKLICKDHLCSLLTKCIPNSHFVSLWSSLIFKVSFLFPISKLNQTYMPAALFLPLFGTIFFNFFKVPTSTILVRSP